MRTFAANDYENAHPTDGKFSKINLLVVLWLRACEGTIAWFNFESAGLPNTDKYISFADN